MCTNAYTLLCNTELLLCFFGHLSVQAYVLPFVIFYFCLNLLYEVLSNEIND